MAQQADRAEQPLAPWIRLRRFLQEELWTADLETVGRLERLKLRLLRLGVSVISEFREGALSLRALGLVYTTLLSLVPFLAVAFSVLKAFGAHYRVEPFLAQALEPLGPRSGEVTRRIVEFVSNIRVGVLGAAGVVGLFLAVLSLLGQVEDALNHVWRARRARSLARKFTDYLSMVLVGPVLVFAALGLIASAQSHWIVQRVVESGPFGAVLVPLVGRMAPFALLCVAFAFLYKFVPQAEVHLGSALVGGATAAILWQLVGTAFAAFIATSPRYTAIYSGFAILIIFLIWLYVAWLVVLVGGQVAYFHQHSAAYLTARPGRGHRYREHLALAVLAEIARRHLAGEPPARPVELAGTLNAPPAALDDLIDDLVRRGILLRTAEPRGVVLGRPPEQVSVATVLDVVSDPDSDSLGTRPGAAAKAATLLARRDEAVRRAVEGLTLRSLVDQDTAEGGSRPMGGDGAPRVAASG